MDQTKLDRLTERIFTEVVAAMSCLQSVHRGMRQEEPAAGDAARDGT